MTHDQFCPKLRLDTQFLPFDEGVLFRSREKVFTLKGRGIYELVSALAPHLNGQLTVRDICEILPQAKRQIVTHLLDTLIAKQLVIHRVEENVPLPEPVRRVFRGQLEFIEHFADRPLERFSRLREAKVFVTGSGPAVSHVCVSLVRNGVRTVILDRSVTSHPEEDLLAREVEGLRAAQVEVEVVRRDLACFWDEVADGPTALCFASDAPHFRALLHLNEQSVRRDTLFVPGYLLGGKAVVGPSVGRRPGCFACSLLRRAPHLARHTETELWRGIALSEAWTGDRQPFSSPALRILANLVAFEVFKGLIGHLPQDTDQAIASIDLETLETRTSRLIAHPQCPHCSKLLPAARSRLLTEPFEETSPLSQDEQIAKMDPAIDPDYGVFHGFEDDALPQTPLFRSSLAVWKRGYPETSETPGYSLESNAAARIDAFLEAARRLAFEDRAQASWPEDPDASLFEKVNPKRLSHALGISAFTFAGPTPWLPARSLRKRTFHRVPAAAVFPSSSLNAGWFEALMGGMGVGFTPQEAAGDAISSLIATEVLKRVACHELPLCRMNLARLAEENTDISYLMSVLQHLGVSPFVFHCELAGYGAVALAGSDPRAAAERVAVGYGLNLPRSSARALTGLAALSLGGSWPCTLQSTLPAQLGYDSRLDSVSLAVEENAGEDAQCSAMPADWFDDILICDATPPDLAACGVTACRALMLLPEHPPVQRDRFVEVFSLSAVPV